MNKQQILQQLSILGSDAQPLLRLITNFTALDTVFQAVLVNCGEAIGRADKLDPELDAGCLEPRGLTRC
ncbi:hypothetical protein A6033_17695 [Aeromonas veronii]|nr:hypothetical protein A6033_17695 [Aeromonas veronii]